MHRCVKRDGKITRVSFDGLVDAPGCSERLGEDTAVHVIPRAACLRENREVAK